MGKIFGGLGAIVLLGLSSLCACATTIDPAESTNPTMQELNAAYTAGDTALNVIAYGDWRNTNVDVTLEYRHGAQRDVHTVNFEQWSASPDPRTAEFIAQMDPGLVDSALLHLRESPTDDAPRAAFNHLQLRVLSSMEATHAHDADGLQPQLVEGEKCYCYYCQVHHPPYCMREKDVK